MYRNLDADKTLATIELLERRIGERFPDAGLHRVCAELRTIASEVGRDYDTLEITGTWRVAAQPDALSAYTDLGVSRLIVPLFSTGETTYQAAIDAIAKRAGL